MAASSSKRPDVPRNLKPYFLYLLKKGPRWNVTDGNEDLMAKYLAWLRRETEAGRRRALHRAARSGRGASGSPERRT